jgi:VCBS repeat-containing protein
VDFSKYAGQTLILYNDAPTPAPAFDSRLDYFTGDGDQTPIGGAPNTPAGYGPNTRTIMQVVVDGTAPNLVPFSLPTLKAAFATTAAGPGIFASTQPTTIVPEPAYNAAYNASFPPVYAPISALTLTFNNPLHAQTFESLLSAEPTACTGTTTAPTYCASLNHKAIQELFTLDYGRMNATLGTELPNVNFTNQTTIPLGYVDPATEIIRQGDTQLWKITHNGVDSHFIHFHLFNVEVINRVGWDGSLRPPDANEMGWKDTVRMNPLEDVIVALQPITPQLPWPIPNSVRLNDVTGMGNMFSNLDPFSNNGAVTVDGPTNFGWEYVWHCHILGHEENDMMRPIVWQVPPPAPSNLTAAFDTAIQGQVDLSFTDNSASETQFLIQRDTNSAFPNPVTLAAVPSSSPTNPAGEGYTWGGTIIATDVPPIGSTFFYRVQAVDNGFTTGNEQSYNATSALSSAFSNVATAALLVPITTFTGAPASAVFGSNFIVTATSTGTTTPAITVSGPCSVTTLGGTASSYTAQVFMNSGTGSCVMTATWPIGGGFAGAMLQQTTAATKATPTTTLVGALSTSPYNSSFVMTATTNASTIPTIIGTAGVCSVGAVSGTAASATATVTMTSGTGTCVLTATWLPDLNYASALKTQSTTATKLNSRTTITARSVNPSVAGQPVTVSYSVVSQTALVGGAAGPSGNVTVTGNGSSCIGTVAAGSGSCALTFANAGSFSVTAAYAGDANFNGSTSASVTQTVRNFSLSVTPKTQAVNGNQQAKYTATVTSQQGFSGSVVLTCGGTYPSSFSCSMSPVTVTVPAGGSVTSTLTVNTVKGVPGTYTVTVTGKYGTGVPSSGGLTQQNSSTVTTKN